MGRKEVTMNNVKKILTVVAVCMCAGFCMARPAPRHHHRPVHHHHHGHHHHHRGWGVAAGIVGSAIVGGAIYNALTPRTVVVQQPTVVTPAPVVVQSTPVVVQQPVYQTQNVWVEGRYVDQVQANGTVIRVWQPGHYEQRTVQVQ